MPFVSDYDAFVQYFDLYGYNFDRTVEIQIMKVVHIE